MTQSETKYFLIKPDDYLEALRSKGDFFIQFKRFTEDVESQLIKMIHRFLENYDLIYYKDTVTAIIKELVNNAVKANLKRLYFESLELDINNTNDYRKGMNSFKDDVFQKENEIIKSIQMSKYMVRVKFGLIKDNLTISVINNSQILESELNKIKSRVTKAYRYKNIPEAFTDVLDDSEGAGLGLIISLMLIKNSGFPKNSFTVSRNNALTSINLSIPNKVLPQEAYLEITENILKEIEEIPALPDNINEIRALVRDPKSEISDIAKAISRDPGLTASIMKLANSAGYITSKRLETIDEAIKIIGIKGTNTLLIATGAQKALESKYEKYENLWIDSYKRAFYAQLITRKIHGSSKLADQAYISALLADIGKIIMMALQTDTIKKIKEINGLKNVLDIDLLEEISLGISHSQLGALVCKKWNFNESLTKTIELHHRPHRAEPEFQNLIFIVYLADVMVEIEHNNYKFEIADDEVLKFFKLNDKKKFEEYHTSLKNNYNATVEF